MAHRHRIALESVKEHCVPWSIIQRSINNTWIIDGATIRPCLVGLVLMRRQGVRQIASGTNVSNLAVCADVVVPNTDATAIRVYFDVVGKKKFLFYAFQN